MADLTTSANVDSLLQAANFAAFRSTLGLDALAILAPGTGVATALAIAVGSIGAIVVFNGAGGTPSSLTLTNATGLPISTGVSGLATGIITFLTTPSGANLASALTTALPATKGGTGLTTLGTGVATALGINIGSAGALVLFNGAIGTPTSGILSACTVDGTSLVGFLGAPDNSKSANYTTVLTDSGKCIFHPSSDANSRTFTIDSNANVPYPVGTILLFENDSANAVTIAITSDTLVFCPSGTTGSRTLAQYGRVSARKIGSTRWNISGINIT